MLHWPPVGGAPGLPPRAQVVWPAVLAAGQDPQRVLVRIIRRGGPRCESGVAPYAAADPPRHAAAGPAAEAAAAAAARPLSSQGPCTAPYVLLVVQGHEVVASQEVSLPWDGVAELRCDGRACMARGAGH
jgi:hypothetical protein